jgi:hypothetical protein
MIKFIRYVRALRIALFGIPQNPCRHNWEILEKVTVWGDPPGKYPIRFDRTLRCCRCGDLKTFKG